MNVKRMIINGLKKETEQETVYTNFTLSMFLSFCFILLVSGALLSF